MSKKDAKKEAPAAPVVVSYKGFDKDLTCRKFKFEVGKSYAHEGDVKACSAGFHACEYPLDVFNYYAPAGSRFALVEQGGRLDRHADDSKVASERIEIKAELSIGDLVKAAVKYTRERCKPVDPESPAQASGYQGAAQASGVRGAAQASGDQGAAQASGDQGAAQASGDQGAAQASGYQGAAQASGYQGAAQASGVRGAAQALGKYSVAMAIGSYGKAKGLAGCAIVLVNRDESDGSIRHIRCSKVGENGIKPDTWYTLSDEAEFVEVEA